MNYSQLIQTYFERSVALQWYWTVYILVIGGVLGFSTFRLRADIVTTVLVCILFLCFAYKNDSSIEATALEREAILAAIKDAPTEANAGEVTRVRSVLEPTLTPYDIPGARNFHIVCDLLTIAFLAAAERRRRNPVVPA